MSAPKMNVKCSVDNCTYNQEHMCHAHTLEVNAKGGHNADSSEGTVCSTFINENK